MMWAFTFGFVVKWSRETTMGSLRFQSRSTPMETRLGALRLYRKHLVDQYADRCGFWALKAISGQDTARTCVIMTDGADQAKYCLPRDPSLRSAYRASKLRRSRLKLHGAWAFGYCCRICLVEETVPHGSSMVTEVLAHTLEQVAQVCEARQQPFPSTVMVIGDNTVKECKNQWLMGYIASLIGHGKVKQISCSLGFEEGSLRVMLENLPRGTPFWPCSECPIHTTSLVPRQH